MEALAGKEGVDTSAAFYDPYADAPPKKSMRAKKAPATKTAKTKAAPAPAKVAGTRGRKR